MYTMAKFVIIHCAIWGEVNQCLLFLHVNMWRLQSFTLWLIQVDNYHHPRIPPTVAMVTTSRNWDCGFIPWPSHCQKLRGGRGGGEPGSIHLVSNTNVCTCRQTGGRTLLLNHRYSPGLNSEWKVLHPLMVTELELFRNLHSLSV